MEQDIYTIIIDKVRHEHPPLLEYKICYRFHNLVFP